MELKIYTKSDDSEYFTTKCLPDKIEAINLYLSTGGGGQIEYTYITNNKITTKSDCLCFDGDGHCVSYILVNNKDKFVIRKRKDIIAFYKYLTDFDINKFIKEFKAFDKEHKLKEDFDED